MKSISTINSAITENTECSIVKVHNSFMDLKVGVLLDHGVSLYFVLLPDDFCAHAAVGASELQR